MASEVKTPALHLFRHLIRATSYLPDEFARAYIHNYIKYKFVQARKTSEHTSRRLEKGRTSLNILQRATNGDIKCLTKVLYRAYGRSGRRRRELVQDLLRADAKLTPENGVSPESPTIESINKEEKWESPRPLLTMFLKSQAAHNPPENRRPPIRHFEPEIPKNIFDRPMALKRQRNIVKRFWASTLDKILPPLPEVEWNRLRDLATGVIPFEKPPPRRIPAGAPGKETALLHAAAFLKQSIRTAARPAKDARLHERNRHIINARFMRRIWAGVWSQCPLMTYNGETMEWTIVWGGSRSAASRGLTGTAGKKDLELFEGLNELDNGTVHSQKPANHKRNTECRQSRKSHSLPRKVKG